MRVLLDECIDQRLVEYLQQFDVRTVVGEGWAGISNGKLLELAQTRFDVFVTVDRNLSFQQHLPKFSVAVALATFRRKNDECLPGDSAPPSGIFCTIVLDSTA